MDTTDRRTAGILATTAGVTIWGASSTMVKSIDGIDATGISFHRLRYEGMYTPPTEQEPGMLLFPGTLGGMNWGGGGFDPVTGVAFMLDQCHNIEDKIPGQIRSVLNVQEMTARVLLLDADALRAAQEAGDVLGANEVFMDAFYRDVRPELAAWRESRGFAPDPMRAFLDSGYLARIAEERVGGTQAGWGA